SRRERVWSRTYLARGVGRDPTAARSRGSFMSDDVRHTRLPVNVRLRGQHSGGQLAVIEIVVGADNGGPPLHVHPEHAEGFYILDGELEVQVGEEVVTGSAGAFFFAPP